MAKRRTSGQTTRILRRPRRKTPDAELPVTTCPHCSRTDVQVMPSKLMAMHTSGRWKRIMCRGGGEPVEPTPPITPGKPKR